MTIDSTWRSSRSLDRLEHRCLGGAIRRDQRGEIPEHDAAATGVGSAILVGVEIGPRFGGSVSINEVLGYFGIVAASILGLRVVASVVRDGVV